MAEGQTILAGVMGDPVSHSLSPLLHNHWLKTYSIDGAYLPYHVLPCDLADALKALPAMGIAGVNLTIPHKEKALELIDEISDVAKRIGAVNTIRVKKDGTLYGTNTDAEGFIENLKQQAGDLSSYLEHCLIIGAGGAAKGVAVALKNAGAKQIAITNRSAEKAEALAKALDAEMTPWEDKEQVLEKATLVVNTTSLGMKGQPALELPLDALAKTTLVTDIVYHPLITPLLKEAKVRGNPIVTGIGMLIHQAVPGFEMWFGKRPEVSKDIYQLLESQL